MTPPTPRDQKALNSKYCACAEQKGTFNGGPVENLRFKVKERFLGTIFYQQVGYHFSINNTKIQLV